ncbi:uncharacterized protein LOC105436135 isoform X3 [Cucumis sativus]|uniref:uncharacterized protein LOC105436135 isoform X3 n=1 Tax=Cucumis sativus TaxID=3659 RepID=UPI0012F4814D|nr:uncharacterized protein LOC105436135 isoform X3 [Cucumis sativus]
MSLVIILVFAYLRCFVSFSIVRILQCGCCDLKVLHPTSLTFALRSKPSLIENKEDQYMQLRKLFRARLSEFVSSHRESDDVPKDLLPNPFNFRSQEVVAKSNLLSPIKTSIEQLAPEQPMPSIEGISFNHHSEENQGFRIVKSIMHVTGPTKQKEFIGLSHFSPSFSRRFSQKVVDT